MSRHAVAIAAPRALGQSSAPYLLERDDPDFVGAVLADLSTPSGHKHLQATRASARTPNQVLKLFQPVQRRFHLAVIEAFCEMPGYPRVDPSRVEAAGLVVRRVRPGNRLEGWMKAGGVLRGWVPIDRLGDAEGDPVPAARLARKDTGVAHIDQALRALSATQDSSLLEEAISPMFVAPPAVCAAAGRTFYYGVVPTASGELAQSEPDMADVFEGFGPESGAFRDHLVQPLRGQSWTFPAAPLPDNRFDKSWLRALSQAAPTTSEYRFLQLLRQLAVEFDALGSSAPSQGLAQALAGIQLEYAFTAADAAAAAAAGVAPQRRTVKASDFLSDAIRVLLEGEGGSVELPEKWPALSNTASAALARSMSGALQERFRGVKGRPGRFDDPDARYVLRAFVRVKCDCGCAPRTIWSGYSEPFVIAPWYETVADPIQIALPDLSNRALLKSLKPNVAFTLPPALQALLQGNPKDLMDGKQSGASMTVGWICSFSIPVITFCAFIVLNIFLSLFDLIFNWMIAIKICLPYPKAK